MDSQQPRTDLKSILEETEYFIEFCGDQNESWINVKMDPVASGSYMVKYDPVTQVLVNTYNHRSVHCPPYAVNSITKKILEKICKNTQYPQKLVIYRYGNSVSSKMRQKITNSDTEKEVAMEEIIEDVRISGIEDTSFELAEVFDVGDGWKSYCEFIMGKEIK